MSEISVSITEEDSPAPMTDACPTCGSTDPWVSRGHAWEPMFRCAALWHDVELVPDDRPTAKRGPKGGLSLEDGTPLPVEVPDLTTPISGIVHKPTGADPKHNDDDDVMNLTAPEAACFAQRLLANHLADKHDTDDWAAWGLIPIPELSEGSYRLVLEHLADLAGRALVRADNLDRELGIDSRDLIRRAT